jgi:hypothetical protein
LIATIASDQVFNPQTGLMEQLINVSNETNITMAAVRVTVTIDQRLYNAVGTNGTSPYVEYTGSLAPSNSITMLLEYFFPWRAPTNNPTLTAVGVPAINRTASTNPPPPNVQIRPTLDEPPRVMIEFPSEVGATYTIIYSDTADFSNPQIAQPSITAVATRTQWIDDGPPKTISTPADADSRFYRVTKQ